MLLSPPATNKTTVAYSTIPSLTIRLATVLTRLHRLPVLHRPHNLSDGGSPRLLTCFSFLQPGIIVWAYGIVICSFDPLAHGIRTHMSVAKHRVCASVFQPFPQVFYTYVCAALKCINKRYWYFILMTRVCLQEYPVMDILLPHH